MTLALVTGGESGIGAACCLKLARDGADVIVSYYRDREAAGEICARVEAEGRKAEAVQCDVSNEESVRRLFDSAEAACNIAIAEARPLRERQKSKPRSA